jgi:branched-chain amino acid transport system permease protein
VLKNRSQIALLSFVVLILITPYLPVDQYMLGVLVVCGIYALYAVSLDLIVGFLGVYSFGHAAFFGVGAYVSGVLFTRFGWSYWTTLPVAAGMCGLLGLVFTVPALRTRGIYFAITTLACAEISRLAIVSVPSLTRGYMGLSLPQVSAPLAVSINRTQAFFYIAFGLLLLVCVAIERLRVSRAGRAVLAIRENEPLAVSIGIPAVTVTVLVFGLSACIAGLAGSLYAGFVGIASPDLLSVSYSALALLMVIVGGRGTIWGAVIGAFVFTVVSELLRVAAEWRTVFFSAMLIVSMIALPGGIAAPFLSRLTSRHKAIA